MTTRDAEKPDTKASQVETVNNVGHRDHLDLSKDLTSRVTPFLLFFSFWIALSGWVLNFDISYSGTVYAMPPFNKAFGRCAMIPANQVPGADPNAQGSAEFCALSATAQSVGSSIYLLFMGLGAALSGITGNYLGRRGGLQLGCLIVIVGASGMLGTAGNYTAYVACKCVGAVGIGQLHVIGPMFGVEVAPPSRRGFLVSLFSVGQGLGNLAVACVCLGSSTIRNNWSWKTPIICQIPVAFVYGLVLLIFPESPRWLLLKGKEDQARNSFARYYNKDAQSPEIGAQIQEIQAAIEMERLISTTTHWTEIFHRNNLRRTLTAAAIPTAGSLSGGLAIFTYAAIFLAGIGIKNPFVINVVINCCIVAGTFVGPFTLEFLGRRRTILIGFTSMAICMLIFATVSSGLGQSSDVAHKVDVTVLCLWAFFFGGFVATSQWLGSAEMHSVRLRTYGQAFAITVNDIFQFGCNFWTPYMINVDYGNWGTNVGYFYFAIEVALLVLLFLIVPENARLTLEQIDDFFASGRPAWKTSLAKNKALARQRGAREIESL
jgi:MFS transporter, SP family, sugar:H+ symporter